MENVQQDLMNDAISRMKFGMTVAEAKDRSICIKCKEAVDVVHEQYEINALCIGCATRVSPVI